MSMRRLAAAIIALALPTASPLIAQNSSGRIVGRVVDASRGEPIPGAQVTVEGTVITAIADWTGRYALYERPARTHMVTLRMIGYQHKSVRDVRVQPCNGF